MNYNEIYKDIDRALGHLQADEWLSALCLPYVLYCFVEDVGMENAVLIYASCCASWVNMQETSVGTHIKMSTLKMIAPREELVTTKCCIYTSSKPFQEA